jgi:hypothetical protein
MVRFASVGPVAVNCNKRLSTFFAPRWAAICALDVVQSVWICVSESISFVIWLQISQVESDHIHGGSSSLPEYPFGQLSNRIRSESLITTVLLPHSIRLHGPEKTRSTISNSAFLASNTQKGETQVDPSAGKS